MAINEGQCRIPVLALTRDTVALVLGVDIILDRGQRLAERIRVTYVSVLAHLFYMRVTPIHEILGLGL